MFFVVIVFAGLFISITACQPDVNEDVAEIVVVEKTAVYTPTPEPTATKTAVPTPTVKPTTTNTPTPTATIQPTNTPSPPTATATALPENESLSTDWLITTTELDLLTKEIGIIGWQIEAEWAKEHEVCRTYLGASWSANPNIAINCIYPIRSDITLENVIDNFYERGILTETAVVLKPSLQYENDVALFADWWGVGNGHSGYDLLFINDGALYWANVTIGTPGGYTPEQSFAEFGETAEEILYEMIILNIERNSQ